MEWYNLLRKVFGDKFPPAGKLVNKLFFKLIPTEITVELFKGITLPLNLGDDTQRTTYWRGTRFEYPTGQILSMWCSNATMFFDIGANYGFFSYWMISSHKNLVVHSFEPNPLNFSKISRVKTDNRLSGLNPWHMGLGAERATLPLFAGEKDSGHSTFGSHPDMKNAKITDVQVCVFDDWVEEQGIPWPTQPSWVAKIDVEGFELKVLQGMTKALENKAFVGIMVEILDYTLGFCDVKASDIHALLKSHGYHLLSETKEGDQFPLKKTVNAFFVPEPSSISGKT